MPAMGFIIIANGFSKGGCCWVLARLLALVKLKDDMRRTNDAKGDYGGKETETLKDK
jgi:hypothetical protein